MTIYLDHNATSPVRSAARDAALAAMELHGNASSVHSAGRRAKAVIDDARDQVAALVQAKPREIVFTAGGTEANNLALQGLARLPLLVSAAEHPSVLKARGDAVAVPVNGQGLVDCDALRALLAQADAPALVSVMAANNETGAVQPMADVLAVAQEQGALVHCDAVQAAGRMDGAWRESDLVTLSGHKLGGLQGAGALVVRKHVVLKSVMGGGGQELGLRPGTEPLPAIAAFGAAVAATREDDLFRLADWRDTMQQAMLAQAPGAVVLSMEAERLPNTLCIAHPEIDAETMVMSFDLAGVAISAGSACSSGKMAASHVALAMGYDDLARNAVRLSLGWSTTKADCDRAVTVWSDVVGRHERRHRAA